MRRSLLAFLGGMVVVTAMAGGVLARQATPAASPDGDRSLPPVVWELTEAALADGSVQVPDDPSRYTIQFLPDGRIAAQADCNQVGGSYEINGVGLTLSDLMSTLVGCPDDSLGADHVAWLDAVQGYELTDEGLALSLEDGGTLRFAPSLLGVVWQWRGFLSSNETVIAPEAPDQYTLRFQQDGSLLIQADCNRGGGRYSVDAPVIDIGQIGLTRMACPAGSLADEFVTHLEDVSSFTFAGGELWLALPMDGGVLRFTAEDEAPPATPIAATPDAD